LRGGGEEQVGEEEEDAADYGNDGEYDALGVTLRIMFHAGRRLRNMRWWF
jgi:hypothetical protein